MSTAATVSGVAHRETIRISVNGRRYKAVVIHFSSQGRVPITSLFMLLEMVRAA